MSPYIAFLKSLLWIGWGIMVRPLCAAFDHYVLMRHMQQNELEDDQGLVKQLSQQKAAAVGVWVAALLMVLVAILIASVSSLGFPVLLGIAVMAYAVANVLIRFVGAGIVARHYNNIRCENEVPVNYLEEAMQFGLYGDTTFDYNRRVQLNVPGKALSFGSPPPILNHANFWRSSFGRKLVILIIAGFTLMLSIGIYGASSGGATGLFANALAVNGGFLMTGILANPLFSIALVAIAFSFLVNFLIRSVKPQTLAILSSELTNNPHAWPPLTRLERVATPIIAVLFAIAVEVMLVEIFSGALVMSLFLALPLVGLLMLVSKFATERWLQHSARGWYGKITAMIGPTGLALVAIGAFGLFGVGSSLVLVPAWSGTLLGLGIVLVVAAMVAWRLGDCYAEQRSLPVNQANGHESAIIKGHKVAEVVVAALKVAVLIGALMVFFLGIAAVFNVSVLGLGGLYAYAFNYLFSGMSYTLLAPWFSTFVVGVLASSSFLAIMIIKNLLPQWLASPSDWQPISKIRQAFFMVLKFSPAVLTGVLWILSLTGGFGAGTASGFLPLFLAVSLGMVLFTGNSTTLLGARFKQTWDKWFGVAYVEEWENSTINGWRWKYALREAGVFFIMSISMPVVYLFMPTSLMGMLAAQIILGLSVAVSMAFRMKSQSAPIVRLAGEVVEGSGLANENNPLLSFSAEPSSAFSSVLSPTPLFSSLSLGADGASPPARNPDDDSGHLTNQANNSSEDDKNLPDGLPSIDPSSTSCSGLSQILSRLSPIISSLPLPVEDRPFVSSGEAITKPEQLS